jgi:site-specific recombinase XerD
MDGPSRVRVSGPLKPYARGFAAELSQQGYTQMSAASRMWLMAHLSRWLEGEGLDETALTQIVVEAFMAARRAAGHTHYRSPRALDPLLGYLRGLGAAPSVPPIVETAPEEVLLERYRHYLTMERGLAASTARCYVNSVRPFLAARATADGIDLENPVAGDIAAFVLAECSRRSVTSARMLVKALRPLLAFLHVDGVLECSLAAAVPSIAGWRLAGLPQALEPDQARRLLTSCDRSTVAGSRDFAILTLLSRLGMRAGEVAALELDDLDWRAGEILVRGKGDRRERLPLPTDVGEAVASYLRHGRPEAAAGRRVFVRVRAPLGPVTSSAVTQVVYAAGMRTGLGKIGAHRLRHTAATEMLRAGASLTDIGQVLRHRRLLTTAIYAKTDRESLRILARPWPGGAS